LTNTHDNFVRRALTTGKCPSCKTPVVFTALQGASCPCGFRVGRDEIERHKATMPIAETRWVVDRPFRQFVWRHPLLSLRSRKLKC